MDAMHEDDESDDNLHNFEDLKQGMMHDVKNLDDSESEYEDINAEDQQLSGKDKTRSPHSNDGVDNAPAEAEDEMDDDPKMEDMHHPDDEDEDEEVMQITED